MKEFIAEPGVEYTVHTEWDWTNPEIPKDFSLVAYGMGGQELQLTHKGGLQSVDLPYQPRMGNINSPDTPTVVVPPPLPADPKPTGDGTCDEELKKAVNDYTPPTTIPWLKCGLWYDLKTHSSGKTMVVFKNGCSPTLKTTFTVTMKKTDWDEA